MPFGCVRKHSDGSAYARYPLALAPGMGLNAYFAYSVVKGMGVAWQTALGAVFLSGVSFLVLTLIGVRRLIVSAIPHELYAAVAGGVGLFIALIGFRTGIIVPNPATTVAMGNLRNPATAGGRTGVTAIVTGLMFIAALWLAPLVGAIPAAATAPALIIVGSMMMTTVTEIRWTDPVVAIPAFLTMIGIPLTFSIATVWHSGLRLTRCLRFFVASIAR